MILYADERGGGSLLKILKCVEHTTGCPPLSLENLAHAEHR